MSPLWWASCEGQIFTLSNCFHQTAGCPRSTVSYLFVSTCSFNHFVDLLSYFLNLFISLGKRLGEGEEANKLSQDSLPSQRKEVKPQVESRGRESADWLLDLLLTFVFF